MMYKGERRFLRFIICIIFIIIAVGLVHSTAAGITVPVNAPGFSTHLYVRPSNLNLSTFKKNIDEIAAKGSNLWIRFSLDDIDAFPRTNINTYSIDCNLAAPVNCNPTNLAVYDQAIDYAISKGLNVFLVTNVPSWAKVYSPPVNSWERTYTLSEYKQISASFYQILAGRYKGKVAIWQIFNEANIFTFDSYKPFVMDTTYLNLLNQVNVEARSKVRSIDPSAIITTNTGGWPYDLALHNQWKQYFDSVHGNFDYIALDIYPDRDQTVIDSLVSRVQEFKSRYGKPVTITETGMCTDIARFNETDQAAYVPKYIGKFRQAEVALMFIFEYQDNMTHSGTCEQEFGIKNADGTKKSSYNTIVNSLLFAPTPTPAATTTATSCLAPVILSKSDSKPRGSGTVTFTWRSVSGATKYKVERQKSDGTWSTRQTSSSTSFSGDDASFDPNWRVSVSAGTCYPLPGPLTTFDP